jgi:hypothetical protein
MAERTSAGITTQLGVETNHGTRVAANRFIKSLSFTSLKLRRTVKGFRPQGSRYNTLVVPHKNWGEGQYEFELDYRGFLYVLSGLLPDPTATQLSFSAARKRIYRSVSRGNDAGRRTYTLERGDDQAVKVFPFSQLQSMTLALSQDELKGNGDLVAQKPIPNQVQTADATEVEAHPAERGQIDVFLDTDFDDLGTTQLESVFGEMVTLGKKWRERWAHNTAASSFQGMVDVPPDLTFSFSMMEDAQARAKLDDVDANQIHYLVIRIVGDQIAESGHAGGSLTFSANPTDAEALPAINGVVFTFKDAPAGATDVLRAGNLAGSIANLITALNASANGAISVATYQHDPANANAVQIVYDAAGVGGNAFTLAANTAHVTRSGATLTGGAVAAPIYEAITIRIAGQFGEIEELADSDGVYGDTFNFLAVENENFGGSPFEIEVVNDVESL